MAYVPPHLRNKGKSGGSGTAPPADVGGGGGGRDFGGGGRGGGGGYDDRRGGGGGGRDFGGRGGGGGRDDDRRGGGGRSYESAGGGAAPAASSSGGNSRWADFGEPTRHMRGDFGRGGGGSAPPGFHGDTRSNARMERTIFGDASTAGTAVGINFDKYDKIPVEVSGDNPPEPVESFEAMDLPQTIRDNLARSRYSKPTPVQKYSLPCGQAGRDMMACAQTGSGKTAGFLLPVISLLLSEGAPEVPPEPSGSRSRRRKVYPYALVLSPTRELTVQIYDEAQKFCYCTGILPQVVYGGEPVREQARNLSRGCDLLVATPGRLSDLIDRGMVNLRACKFLVLDEADRMLDMGFEPQIRKIVEQEGMPNVAEGRKSLMFSATFPANIQRLASDFMGDYIFLAVGVVGSAAKDIKQTLEHVDDRDKKEFLIDLLRTHIPKGQLTLVFTATKRNADHLEDTLCRLGFPATSIHGDRSQRERMEALASFKSGRTPVMVATDVAARGLDINNVMYVINFDMPNSVDDYVHRIGRTGRCGNEGNAISFMNDKNGRIARDLYDLMMDNDQQVPDWLESLSQRSYGGGGGGGKRRGGGGAKFGGRDARSSRGGGGGGGGRDRDRGRDRDYGGGGGGFGGGFGGGGGGGRDNSSWD